MTKKRLVVIFLVIMLLLVIFYSLLRPDSDRDLLKETNTKVVLSAWNGKWYRLYLSTGREEWVELKTIFGRDCITPVFSPDGRGILYAEHDGNDYELCYYDLTTKSSKRLTNNKFDDYSPVWSPNMKRISWGRIPKMSIKYGNMAEIYVSEWPDFFERQLTKNKRMDAYPVFVSDSNSLIIESGYVGSLFGLFRIYWDGTERPLIYEPKRSGNGLPHTYAGFVCFERASAENPNLFDIFVLQLNSGSSNSFIRLTNYRMPCNPTPRFSPDGSKIAFHRASDKGSLVAILHLNGVKKSSEVIFGQEDEQIRLCRWNRNGTLLACEDFKRKQIVIFDKDGKSMHLGLPGSYRGQRFLEVYNFDIY